jgi:hypothetical protein
MSVEIRLHEPVMLVYTEYHPKKAPNELDDVQLKVKLVSTFEEAAWLEHEILTMWAQRVQDDGYLALPWSPNIGSPTMQLLAKLFELTGYADRVLTGDDAVKEYKAPEQERPKVELPLVITREWLVHFLARELDLAVETVTTDESWYQPRLQWVPSAERELCAAHGKGARVDLICTFTNTAKKLLKVLHAKPLAIGMTEQVQSATTKRFLLYFRMPNGYKTDQCSEDNGFAK